MNASSSDRSAASPVPSGPASAQPAGPARVPFLFTIEFLMSCGANFLSTGVFFYTTQRFGWTLRSNFILAAAQGCLYVCGAMSAGQLRKRWSPRGTLMRLFTCMMLVGLTGFIFPRSLVLAVLLPLYSGIGAASWPILESLVASGFEAAAMAGRIAAYNLAWSGAGALVLAVNGWIIEHYPGGVLAIPAILNGTCAVLIRPSRGVVTSVTTSEVAPHRTALPHVEPELLRLRTVALWLSRVALPATYVLIYSLMALMPSLPVLRPFTPAKQTLICSTWMAARLVTFFLLGIGTWWHTRPRILLVAALAMLIAFLGVVIRPSDLLGPSLVRFDILSMLAWQILLGCALGMIYCGSLYFGMALSDGSTEHGGYHEALIGLGSILGPGAGAIAQWLHPGDVHAGIVAVGWVVAASVFAVAVTSLVIRRKAERTV
jgi:hypothetical protein